MICAIFQKSSQSIDVDIEDLSKTFGIIQLFDISCNFNYIYKMNLWQMKMFPCDAKSIKYEFPFIPPSTMNFCSVTDKFKLCFNSEKYYLFQVIFPSRGIVMENS